MGKHRWDYRDARSSSHGPMICGACNKRILVGRYRVRETPKAYVVIHEACCQDDPQWAEWGARIAAVEERHRQFVAACIEFKRRWNVDELDDYIPDDQLRAIAAPTTGAAR